MRITYKIALAIGKDAGTRNMKASGRTEWNDEDFAIAADVTRDLLEKAGLI